MALYACWKIFFFDLVALIPETSRDNNHNIFSYNRVQYKNGTTFVRQSTYASMCLTSFKKDAYTSYIC
jgi:hypothetical protein